MGPPLARLSPLANLTRMAFPEPLVKGQSHSPLAILTRMALPDPLLEGTHSRLTILTRNPPG